MLTARNEHGVLITLPERLTQKWSDNLRKKQPYYCPCCASELIIKAGQIKIPHFAHKKTSTCFASTEPESQYHLLGKRRLFTWFEKNGIEVELEAYFPEIKQRADLLINYLDNPYAIEFQCSTIPEEDFTRRTKAYQDAGITPIWILAENRLSRKGNGKFSLSAFQWLFATNNSSFPRILTLCPTKNQLGIIENMIPFSSRIAFAHFSQKSLTFLNPELLFSPYQPHSISIDGWKQQRKAWSLYRVRTATLTSPFFQALYKSHLSPALLPPEIGLPVGGMAGLETAAIEWQGWLYMDILQKTRPGQRLTNNHFYHSYNRRIRQGLICPRALPLLHAPDRLLPVRNYMELLIAVDCLEGCGEGSYLMKNPLTVPKTSDEYVQLEKVLYDKLNDKIFLN